MIAFRSSAGISSVDMYKLNMRKANSVYERSFHSCWRPFVISFPAFSCQGVRVGEHTQLATEGI